jgi:hypothetical protein
MPSRARLPYAALAGLIAACLVVPCVGAQETPKLDPQQGTETPVRPDSDAEHGKTKKPAQDAETATVVPVPAGDRYKRPCETAETREEYDLCQQWRMAQETEKLVSIAGRQNAISTQQTEIAGFLKWIAVIETVLVGFATSFAWRAAHWAKRAAKSGDDTLAHVKQTTRQELRAYVLRQGVLPTQIKNSQGLVTHYAIDVIWENCGQTPALRCRVAYNDWREPAELPEKFEFPDYDTTHTTYVQLGPGQTLMRRYILSTNTMDRAKNGILFIYFWSWIEYDDIFSEREKLNRHRTEMFFKLNVFGNIYGDAPGVLLDSGDRFNGADEDCHHQPKTK